MNKTKKNSNRNEEVELLRQVVALLYYQQGLSQPEIAKRIKISTGKLNSYMKGLNKNSK